MRPITTSAANPTQDTIRLKSYAEMCVEQTKQARIKARMEKSIASHQYQIAMLTHKHRMIEACTWSCLVGGFALCLALLFLPAFLH